MTLNTEGAASVTNLNNGKLLEVQAYERQLSYIGAIDFSFSPQPGDKNLEINNLMGLTGPKDQISTPFSATKFDHITPALASRMMKSAIGNGEIYPEY